MDVRLPETEAGLEPFAAQGVNATILKLDRALAELVLDTLVAGAQASLTSDGQLRAAERIQFDRMSPGALQYANEHAAELIRDISRASQTAIRKVIADGIGEKLTVRQIAKQLQSTVGLTKNQATSIRKATAGDPKARERRTKQAIRDRATMIARTEVMTAVNEGQRQLWEQQITKGKLPPTAHRIWIVTPDDRTCPICRGLEDAVAPVKGSFPGGLNGPPAHPMCRCAQGLYFGPVEYKDDPQYPGLVAAPISKPTGRSDVFIRKGGGTASGQERAQRGADYAQEFLERIRTEFPELRTARGVEWDFLGGRDRIGKSANGVWSGSRFTQPTIQIALGPDRYQQAGGEQYIFGGWTAGGVRHPNKAFTSNGWKDTIRHEYGHHVHLSFLADKSANWPTGLSDSPMTAWERIYYTMPRTTMASRVSQYGASSAAELFAESFSVYTHPAYPAYGKLPQEIHDFMERYLGQRKNAPVKAAPQAAPPPSPPRPVYTPPPPSAYAPKPVTPTTPVGPTPTLPSLLGRTSPPGSKLNTEDIRRIRLRKAAGEDTNSIARAFGVKPDHIRAINRGQVGGPLTTPPPTAGPSTTPLPTPPPLPPTGGTPPPVPTSAPKPVGGPVRTPSQLTDDEIRAIHARKAAGDDTNTIAKNFNVKPDHIRAILRGDVRKVAPAPASPVAITPTAPPAAIHTTAVFPVVRGQSTIADNVASNLLHGGSRVFKPGRVTEAGLDTQHRVDFESTVNSLDRLYKAAGYEEISHTKHSISSRTIQYRRGDVVVTVSTRSRTIESGPLAGSFHANQSEYVIDVQVGKL